MMLDYFIEKVRIFYFVCIVKMVRIICESCNLLIGKIENFSGRYLNMCRIIYVKKKDYFLCCKIYVYCFVMKSVFFYCEEMVDEYCIVV